MCTVLFSDEFEVTYVFHHDHDLETKHQLL
jgi:hypothetical protein